MTGSCVLVEARPPRPRPGEDPAETGWTICACPNAATAEAAVAAMRARRADLRAARARAEAGTRAWLDRNPPDEPTGTLSESAHRRAARAAWRTAWAAALGRPLDALDRLALEILEDGWDVAADAALVPWIATVPVP